MHTSKHRSNIRHHIGTSSSTESSASALFSHSLRSALITLIIGGAVITVLSLFAYFTENPSAFVLPFGILGAALTAFIGGVVSARLHKHSALLCGMLNGLTVLTILMLLSLFFSPYASGHSLLLSSVLHTAFLFLSVIGAFCGLPRAREKKKKRMRTR